MNRNVTISKNYGYIGSVITIGIQDSEFVESIRLGLSEVLILRRLENVIDFMITLRNSGEFLELIFKDKTFLKFPFLLLQDTSDPLLADPRFKKIRDAVELETRPSEWKLVDPEKLWNKKDDITMIPKELEYLVSRGLYSPKSNHFQYKNRIFTKLWRFDSYSSCSQSSSIGNLIISDYLQGIDERPLLVICSLQGRRESLKILEHPIYKAVEKIKKNHIDKKDVPIHQLHCDVDALGERFVLGAKLFFARDEDRMDPTNAGHVWIYKKISDCEYEMEVSFNGLDVSLNSLIENCSHPRFFGVNVAMNASGDRVFVAGRGCHIRDSQLPVFIYDLKRDKWELRKSLTMVLDEKTLEFLKHHEEYDTGPSMAIDASGRRIAFLCLDRVLVCFEKEPDLWIQECSLEHKSINFGTHVNLSSDRQTLAVNIWMEDKVLVYKRQLDGSWVQDGPQLVPINMRSSDSEFGDLLQLSPNGDILWCPAPDNYDFDGLGAHGSFFLYEKVFDKA